jgi:uncharacterized phage infection (PIP) family protein YhgE
MTTLSVTIDVPTEIYNRVKQRALQSKRTIEAELVDALVTAVPTIDQLSPDLTQVIDSLTLLDDEALTFASQTEMDENTVAELEQLNFKQQREGLTRTEIERLDQLAGQYEKTMLIRAQALLLLKQRGKAISNLTE